MWYPIIKASVKKKGIPDEKNFSLHRRVGTGDLEDAVNFRMQERRNRVRRQMGLFPHDQQGDIPLFEGIFLRFALY